MLRQQNSSSPHFFGGGGGGLAEGLGFGVPRASAAKKTGRRMLRSFMAIACVCRGQGRRQGRGRGEGGQKDEVGYRVS